ncbi:MAG: hypothetical protein WC389_00055 [Lutibacter sp.]|jgi:hypothetical protein
MVIESRNRPGGYFINGKFVLAVNWEISKENFTKGEQQEFLSFLLGKLLKKIESDINKLNLATYNNVKTNLYMSSIVKREKTEIKYTNNFLAWLKSEPIEDQDNYSLKALFEIYINQICWNEIEKDPELEASDLILRM